MSAAVLDRKDFLGGTDTAAVIGVSNWCTALHLWELKTGRAAANESDEALQKIRERGRKLEPFIRDMAIDKLRDQGHDVELVTTNQRYFDPRYPFLSVEIDFELRVDGELMNADAKSVSAYARRLAWGEEGSEEIPIEYAAQFQTGLMVAPGKRRRCLVAALRSFDDVELFWCDRRDDTIKLLRKRLVHFWREHVQKDVPPAPTTLADVRALFPRANGRSIEADDKLRDLVQQWREAAKAEKDAKARIELIKFHVARHMEDFELLTDGHRDLVRFEDSTAVRMDTRAFKSQHRDWYELYCKENRTRTMRLVGKV